MIEANSPSQQKGSEPVAAPESPYPDISGPLVSCKFCGTTATPNDEPNCSSLEEAWQQTPTRPYGCPWFDKDARKAHPPQAGTKETKLVYIKRWRTLVELPTKYADEIVEALRETSQPASVAQAVPDPLREALDSSQSLLAMIHHLGTEYELTRNLWDGEDLTKLTAEQITENRAALSLPSTPAQSPCGCQTGDSYQNIHADLLRRHKDASDYWMALVLIRDLALKNESPAYKWGAAFTLADHALIEPSSVSSIHAQCSPEPALTALRAIYEWYDRDGSVGEADRIFEENRSVLTSTVLSPAVPIQGPKQYGWPVSTRVCDCVTGEVEPGACHCERASEGK